MAVSLTLTPLSNAIIATISGLDTEHKRERLFVWHLDGKEYASETAEPSGETHSFTFAPLYFASSHTVGVEIYDSETGELFTSETAQTSTLYADIPLWSWTASNGHASQAQTTAAHRAATTQSLVSNYSHLVWDDFVRRVKDALDAVGLPWLTTYASYGNALVGETNGSLTAQRFNSVVQNIRYPYWTWEIIPSSYGYLGRQAVRRGDNVFGQYLIELAEHLNVVLSLYNGTANTRETSASMAAALIHNASAMARHPAPVIYTGRLGSLGEAADLARRPPVLFGADGRSALTHESELLRRPVSPFKQSRNLRLSQMAALTAQFWHSFVVRESLSLSGSSALRSDGSRPLGIHTAFGLALDMKMVASPANLMQSAEVVSAICLGDLSNYAGANLHGGATVDQLATATLQALRQTGMLASFSANFQTCGDMIQRAAANASGAFSAGVSAVGLVNAIRPVMVSGEAITQSEIIGTLWEDGSQTAQGASNVLAFSSGNIEQKTPERVGGRSLNTAEASGTLSNQSTVLHLFGSAGVMAIASGLIGEAQDDPTWIYPAQNGDVLYIAQSYHTDEIVDGIRIAWRLAVADGDVLYIPQVLHADEKDGVLSLIYHSEGG